MPAAANADANRPDNRPDGSAKCEQTELSEVTNRTPT
jgi:hypothetical protein